MVTLNTLVSIEKYTVTVPHITQSLFNQILQKSQSSIKLRKQRLSNELSPNKSNLALVIISFK